MDQEDRDRDVDRAVVLADREWDRDSADLALVARGPVDQVRDKDRPEEFGSVKRWPGTKIRFRYPTPQSGRLWLNGFGLPFPNEIDGYAG